MTADILLSRLERVHKTGPASWRADCPNGHNKARGSLAITQADDGRLLCCCFACHDTPGILAAVGLELADLFPDRIKDPSPEGRRQARDAFRRSAWGAALAVLNREAYIIEIAAHDLAEGKALSTEDHSRLLVAVNRVHDAKEVLR